jgi:hypothetical protein
MVNYLSADATASIGTVQRTGHRTQSRVPAPKAAPELWLPEISSMVVIIGPFRRTEKKRENTIQLVMKMLWFCDFGDPKSLTTTMM